MSRPSSSWSEEKRAVVEAVLAGRMTGREVMDQLGITSSTLGGWVRAEQCRKARGSAPGGFVAVDVRSEAVRRGLALLTARPPSWDVGRGTIDFAYWRFGTMVAFQAGGETWNAWNLALTSAVANTQHQ